MTNATAWNMDWFDGCVRVRTALAWRGVEAQHVVATMRLVDSSEEQALLEELLETSKPALPATQRPMHYLLSTPFRYRPAHASRFRRAHERGLWYGARSLRTACAEVAYWRHRFLLDSAGLAGEVLLTQHTFFQARLRGASIDLMAPPWNQCRDLWTHATSYAHTHALADAARARGLQWLNYESARDPGHACVVAFDPAALSEPPGGLDASRQTWHCKATAKAVMMTRGEERYTWRF